MYAHHPFQKDRRPVITTVLTNIFRVNLGVRKNEKVLVFTDIPSPAERADAQDCEERTRLQCLAFLAAEVGKGISRDVVLCTYEATGVHGGEPPKALWEAAFGKAAVTSLSRSRILEPLLAKRADDKVIARAEEIIRKHERDSVDAVIALSYFSTSHTLFRELLTRTCGARYASMPFFEMSMLEGPMNADWKRISRVTRAVAARLNRHEKVEMTTANGTDLSFFIKGRKAGADTGILTRPGAFGNLPAGEAYIAPVEGTANGRLVVAWAPTGELTSPITLVVKNGSVEDVLGGGAYVVDLEKTLSERKENRNIAEFGIGTNPMAKRPDNILEAEKILGTVHVAVGDNSTFGGKVHTPFHQDFVFFRPDVLLYGEGGKTVLMKDGKLIEVKP